FGNGMMQLWQGTGSAWTAPVASAIAMALSFIPETGAMVLFFIAWWIHTIRLLAFFVYVQQSKHAHLIAAPLNMSSTKRVRGKLKTLQCDFDEHTPEEDMLCGAGKVEDFGR